MGLGSFPKCGLALVVKVPQGFGKRQMAWAVKASFLFERFRKASALGSKNQRGSTTSSWVILCLFAALTRRRKVKAGWLVSVCAAVQALVGKGWFCFAIARQGWRRRFRQSRLAKAAVLAVRRRLVGWSGFGERGRVGWGTAVWRGRGFGRETAVGVSPWPGKAGTDVVGQAGWRWQRFCRLWRRLVGSGLGDCEWVSWQRPVLSTRVMEGERPFYVKLSRNSQRRSQFSQSASAQSFNKFRSGKPAKALVRRPA